MSKRDELRAYALTRLADGMAIAGLQTSNGHQTHAALIRNLDIDRDSPRDLQYVGAKTLCSRDGTYFPPDGGMPYTYDELPSLSLYKVDELLRIIDQAAEEQRKQHPLGNLDPFNRVGPVTCSPCRGALYNIVSAQI